jgi:hypothetical protein
MFPNELPDKEGLADAPLTLDQTNEGVRAAKQVFQRRLDAHGTSRQDWGMMSRCSLNFFSTGREGVPFGFALRVQRSRSAHSTREMQRMGANDAPASRRKAKVTTGPTPLHRE